MIGALFEPALLPFGVALCGVVLIAAVELASALLGAPLSGLLDEVAPDIDVDVGLDGAFEGGPVETLMHWLSFGKVPVLVLVILLLAGFGAGGVAVQALAREGLGAPLPAGLAAGPALLIGVLAMHWLGGAIGRMIPKDETSAIARSELVGETGIVTGGTARPGMPAQVRLTDRHGTTHYVLGAPEAGEIPRGARVRIVALEGPRARIVPEPA